MKKQWTEDVGTFLARLSKMYSVISNHWAEMGIGTNITAWLETENGKRELEGALKFLGERFIDSLSVDCSEKLNLEEFPGEGWTIWKGPIDGDGLSGEENIDRLSLFLSEVKVSSIIFETCFDNEKQVSGQIVGCDRLIKLRRKESLILAGGNAFLGFWRDYQVNKRNSILEFLWQTKKIGYLDFFGLILRAPNGRCGVLNLNRMVNGEWKRGWTWLTWSWNSNSFSAVHKLEINR